MYSPYLPEVDLDLICLSVRIRTTIIKVVAFEGFSNKIVFIAKTPIDIYWWNCGRGKNWLLFGSRGLHKQTQQEFAQSDLLLRSDILLDWE